MSDVRGEDGMSISLSVLVCSLTSRFDTFLPRIHAQLYEQYLALSPQHRERVELLVLIDNKQMVLGTKRNEMVRIAQGDYVVFVDDDDRIADDYLATLLEATASRADVITFKAEVTIDGGPPKTCWYSKGFGADRDIPEGYLRTPNHICAIRREWAVRAPFPDTGYAEDAEFAQRVLPFLAVQHYIDKVMYFYDFNSTTTETRV